MNTDTILAPEVIDAMSAIGAALIAASTALIIDGRRKKIQSRNKFKNVQDRIDIDAEIHGMLGALLSTTGSDRAYIYQFHPDHSPIYFSCSYEQVAPGVSTEILNRQHLLLTQHSCFLKKLNDTDSTCCHIDNVVNERIGMLLRSQAVKVVCMYPIKNHNGYTIGFVGIDYIHELNSVDGDIKAILSDFSFKVSDKLASYEK